MKLIQPEPLDLRYAPPTSFETSARLFATAAHAAVGQKRKYDGSPYITHCKRVVDLVRSVGHDQDMLAAAWLHDVVEDTQITQADIINEFGFRVADLVAQVTNVSRPEDGNRAVRKAKDRAWLALSSKDGATIKLADLIDNTTDIEANDPKFWKVYREEKRLLLHLLTHGNHTLWQRAWEQVHPHEPLTIERFPRL